MRPIITVRLVLVFMLLICCGNAFAQPRRYLLLGSDFQFKGKWFAETSKESISGNILRFLEGEQDSSSDALTVLKVEQPGNYAIWIRTPDFETYPRTRLFQLSIGNARLKKAGGHGRPGYFWERLGTADLKQAAVLLRLHNFNYGRCDAILLLQDSTIDPNKTDTKTLLSWKKIPEEQPVIAEEKKNTAPLLRIGHTDKVIAGIENENIRLQFVKAGADQRSIACKTEIREQGQWKQAGGQMEDHKVFLITTDATAIQFNKYYPTWDNRNPGAYFIFEGQKYIVQKPGDEFNPFQSGNLSEAIPVSVNAIDKQTIEVQYVTRNGSPVTGFWSLPAGQQHIELRLVCKTAQQGYYSMGVAAFQPVADPELENVLMAPMFQYKRVSECPQMMVTSMMQQPIAIVAAKTSYGPVSTYVAADPETLKKDWGSVDHAPSGFTLKNHQNQVQPVMFAPVLGMKDSKYEAGQLIDRRFIIGLVSGNWDTALAYVSKNIFQVRDYRRQQQASLTDAVFNMIALTKNDTAGGWAKELKGFYDIEGDPKTAPTVVNATPLVNVALSVLQNDEQYYLSRSLPTIEFTLSRSGYRWATDIVPTAFNNTRKTLELNPLTSQFTTSYYVGLNRMLGGLNPWLEQLALPGDSLRAAKGYSTDFIPWNQALWAYHMTGQAKWLQRARNNADLFIQNKIYSNSSKPLSHIPFYNASFYAPWWDLLDLYETTKDAKYLKAAAYGGYFTIAGIRSYPCVEDQQQTIHPGNRYEGITHIWWKGNQPYRLGFPRKKEDVQEKKVPEWLVSPVGLGLEQPSTYFTRVKGQTVHPVFMSSWAPHLLRLFQYAHQPIYEIYARNAVIGRYANYPGYYGTGFTDVPMSANFPYKGPDVSSIYYHHIPPHIGFSLDYLITEAIQRSNGNVEFPYSKQEGFVWFNNRVYGGGKGTIFGDTKAILRMHKDWVQIQNPEINYVTAISDKNFWILLSSEAAQAQPVNIRWAKQTGAKQEGQALCYAGDGQSETVAIKNAGVEVQVPAKGFRAIAIPLNAIASQKIFPPLKEGMKIIDLGKPWGRVFLFRIRSPFGWDSFYGFAETAPLSGHAVTVTCNSQTQEVKQYPYEWSFSKIGMSEPAVIEMDFKTDGSKSVSKKIILNGNE
ncbi:hypothetical protein LL912_17500 [Niabella sp. CC-SYL272]|uniref:hypothetical protein n=1 Tax=Niabella agricola TaxID=2891571 RepID=UPI001F1BD3AE|nr:hypothetical protein [Niabella agricola]MCF3110586.1 hypothetical protein [Niabella agricola]